MPLCNFKTCAISTCNSPKGVSYHSIPRDAKIRKKWIILCKLDPKLDLNNLRICARHFTPEDYSRDLKNELLGLPLVNRLKKNTFPSMNLKSNSERKKASLTNSEETKNLEISKRKALVQSILNEHDLQSSKSQPISSEEKSNVPSLKEHSKMTQTKDQGQSDLLEGALFWKQKHNKLQSIHNRLQNSYNRLYHHLRAARKEIRRLNSKTHQKTKIKDYLEVNHSKTFVNKIMHPSSQFCMSYDKDDVTLSLVLRSISNRAFEYLRSRNIFPLASIRTQERWLNDFKVEPGLQENSLSVIQDMIGATSEDSDKIAAICFDEILLKEKTEVEKRPKKVMTSTKKCQVVMVRGLVKTWKQPIYFDFNRSVNLDLLKSIILRLENVGLRIYAVTFDLGDLALIDEVGFLSSDRSSFTNPADVSREVHLFADAPYLIKIARNMFLEKGFQLSDGNGNFVPMNKNDFMGILNADVKDHQLSMEHLTVIGNARQNVTMARQLFSTSTARAMTYLFGIEKIIQTNAIDTFSDWFECMNGHTVSHTNILKSGFGRHFPEQQESLLKMKALIETMKINETLGLLPWQIGILKSIKSTFALYNDLCKQGIEYFISAQLNKDIIELFFAKIRALGADNSHPSSSEFIQRFKILVVGKNHDLPSVQLEEKKYDGGFLSQNNIRNIKNNIEDDSANKFQNTNENSGPIQD